MSIEALRAKLREAATRSENKKTTTGGGGDKASYPFWNTGVGQTSTIRFLPDGDTENPFFWVERQVIKLPFDGVVGGDYPTNKQVEVTVPCIDMFGMSCPIIAATRHLWNGTDADKEIARTYYKKRSYIFQGLVVNSAFDETDSPENPIRRFVINKSIYDIVYASLLEPNFENLPTEYDGGRDFLIKKTQKGEWANYSTSSWSYSTRSLSETDRANIDKFGLFNLKEALGAVPTAEAIEGIKAMFDDSFNGRPFDMEAYGQFYRPYTNRNDDATKKTVQEAATLAGQTDTQTAATPAVSKETTSSKQTAEDIITRLRAKSAQ